METIEQEISVGDWIRVHNHLWLKGFSGYVIQQCPEDENVFKVTITSNKYGEALPRPINKYFSIEEIEPLRTYRDEDDLLSLIDLALKTRDEKWFKELTAILP